MSYAINLKLSPESISLGKNGLLKHQEDTVNAFKEYPVVLNCAMTGAGKTKASHLAIQSHACDKSVLLVAPTNALVSQHLDDARQFVKENRLPHHVAAVDGEMLFKLRKKYPAIYRSSDALHQLIYNPRIFAEELGFSDNDAPLWLITNPDQIWLSVVTGRKQDTRNLLKDFINEFRFVVVDEFHYYTAEQLTLFFLCMAFWKHFGQFDNGLKMLLLTATPDQMVEKFFQRMEIAYSMAGNETDENQKIPVLAPIELTITSGFIKDFKNYVLAHYEAGKEGLIISDSRFEIDRAFYEYGQMGVSVGRITGEINNDRRKYESRQQLILATQTVDLGFNFVKPQPKERQQIDFLVSTAKTKSAFWQRLGRAGRVLGKKETQIPSHAVMLLSDASYWKRLEPFDGQIISRTDLRDLLDLRDKRLKEYALAREGLYIVTRQLVEIEQKMLPGEKKAIAEKIFATLRECFDPNHLTYEWGSFKKRHGLSKQLENLENEYPNLKIAHIHQHLKKPANSSCAINTLLGAWAKNYFYREGKLELYNQILNESDRMTLISSLLKQQQSLKSDVITYHKEQMLRFKYLFSFRGSGAKEEVWIYDPGELNSSEVVTRLDLIYLLSKYRFNSPLSHSCAEKQWRIRLPKGDIFFEITGFYEYPYRPVFVYDGELPKRAKKPEYPGDEELMPCYWQTVALHNLSLLFENRKIGHLHIPAEVRPLLTGLTELFFITPMENQFVLSNWLKEYDVQTGTLKAEKEYAVVYGKDAILMSEELYYRWKAEKGKSC